MKQEYIINACTGKAINVMKGQTIKIIDIEGTQVVITGTEKLDIENLKYLEYNVSNGKVLK